MTLDPANPCSVAIAKCSGEAFQYDAGLTDYFWYYFPISNNGFVPAYKHVHGVAR